MSIALTIAGSDCSGGAGVQADLKTFAACSVYGVSAVTAITAQSAMEIRSVWPVPKRALIDQLEILQRDVTPSALKTGMLASLENVEVTAWFLRRFQGPKVVDPVLRATVGTALLQDEAFTVFKAQLIPAATVLTPNLSEVEALIGASPSDVAQTIEAAKALLSLGPKAVVITGHLVGDEVVDVLATRDGVHQMRSKRQEGTAHGTGCTYASVIAAELAKGRSIKEAAITAHRYLQLALADSKTQATEARLGVLHHFRVPQEP